MKSPLFLLFFCVVGYPPNWGERPRYIDIDRITTTTTTTTIIIIITMIIIIMINPAVSSFSSADDLKEKLYTEGKYKDLL